MLRLSPSRAALAAGVLPLLCTLVAAQTVVLEPSRDNVLIEEGSGALSNGAGPVLFAGRVRATGNGEIRRAVMAFDVAGSVPAGSTILSASLSMTMNQTSNPSAYAFELHALTADWGEGTSYSTGGIGNLSTAGDATWIHTFYPDGFWTNVGGDFDPAASATTAVADVGVYAWSSTQLAADVQAWLDAPATNQGWILIGDETVIQTAKRFASREDPTPADRPLLTIQYAPPCGVTAAVATRNAGTNPLSYTAGTLVLGGTFNATVDNDAAGQVLSRLIAFETPFSFTLSGGQTLLCIDGGLGELFSGAGAAPVSSLGGVDTYMLPVPNNPALCGFTLCSQAIQFGVSPFALSNAQDLTVGG